MNKLTFLFLTSFYVIISMMGYSRGIEFETQFYGSLFFIGLIGIPHGAIDHVLFWEGQKKKNSIYFFLLYIGLMVLYLVGWLLFSVWSLVFFLILSAYHFGQSQFSDVLNLQKNFKRIINVLWGLSIISGLILYNNSELSELAISGDVKMLMVVFDYELHSYITIVSSISCLIALLYAFYDGQMEKGRLMTEVYTLFLIHICFYILPLIVGFTLYFTVLHSLKVLTEEYSFLKSIRSNFSIQRFILMLLPLTLVSIIGGGIIVYFTSTGIIKFPAIVMILMLISILTLPHSIVMDRFYQKVSETLT